MIRPPKPSFSKLRRLPSRKTMTVCIGSICSEGNDPRIVLVRDWRGEVPEVGSTDAIVKRRHLSKEWVALLAGNTARASELCIRYESYLTKHTFTEANLTQEVRKVFHDYKKELVSSFLQTTYGISFDYLVNSGRDKFGEQFVATCLDTISRFRVDAELIIAGFADVTNYFDNTTSKSPMLCAVSENHDGDVAISEEDFAVIGVGCNAARTMLFYRDQENGMSLMDTMYTAMEAKAMTLGVPGIGESTSLEVMYPDNTLLSLSASGYARCVKLFTRFGPRSIYAVKNREEWFEFKPEYLEPLIESPPTPSPPSPDQETKP
jgi:hypothetical protein